MITKITNANAELYYAPRFAQITAAFKDAGSDIEIKSLEDYFLHLTDIAQLDVGAKNMPEAFVNCFRAKGFCSYVIFLLL